MKQKYGSIPEAQFIPRVYQELHIDRNLIQVSKQTGITLQECKQIYVYMPEMALDAIIVLCKSKIKYGIVK